MATRNSETLADFVRYCEANPEERFWQALRNWSRNNFIFAAERKPAMAGLWDTFYWEGRSSVSTP